MTPDEEETEMVYVSDTESASANELDEPKEQDQQ